jgi:hypothetical protein
MTLIANSPSYLVALMAELEYLRAARDEMAGRFEFIHRYDSDSWFAGASGLASDFSKAFDVELPA